jgi:hypothetical protein
VDPLRVRAASASARVTRFDLQRLSRPHDVHAQRQRGHPPFTSTISVLEIPSPASQQIVQAAPVNGTVNIGPGGRRSSPLRPVM